MRAFAQADKFVAEVESRKLRSVYVFVGDEVFFRRRCRDAILKCGQIKKASAEMHWPDDRQKESRAFLPGSVRLD